MSSLTGLTANTTYYVRAYATNSKGTSYGIQKSFTTSTTTPVVTTSSVTEITQTTATCGGNVTSNGGATVTARGVCWSTTQNPTINNSHTTNGSGTGSFTSNISGLTANTTYYVRAYATNSNGTGYGEQKTFTTQSGGGTGGHEYVDLGLPSGLLWATCNVGADNPEDYGNYYAWGEITTKSTYNWSTYQWCNGSEYTLTKYCTDSNYGIVDDKTVLESDDDVAHVNWGGNWRMPTKEEFLELKNNCTWTQMVQGGNNIYKVTGPNGNSIYLPTAGFYPGSNVEVYGRYWSSSLNAITPYLAWVLFFNYNDNYIGVGDGHVRNNGLSVRPVCPPQK